MTLAERRQAVLRAVSILLVKWRDASETAAIHLGPPRAREIMRMVDEADTLGAEVYRATLPEGRVVFIDDETGVIDLERGRITLAIPNETPDAVADALFRIADSMPPAEGPMRWTMDGLASAVVDSRGRVEDAAAGMRKRAGDCETLTTDDDGRDRELIAKSIVRQCKAAGVACFVKQIGSKPVPWDKPLAHSKGGDMAEWPDDLRVQQMPGDTIDLSDGEADALARVFGDPTGGRR